MVNKKLSCMCRMIAALIGCVMILANVSAQQESMDFFGAVDAENETGYKEYVDMGCWHCHGFQGQSSGGDGPKLAPGPLPYEVFATIVRRPPNVMPAYSPNILSDEQLQRIYAYLQSIPAAPDVSDVPLLSGD